MKLLSCILSLALFVSSAVLAETITTDGGTRVLPPLKSLKSENSLRQAVRIAEIAMSELNSEVAGIAEEASAISEQIDAHEQESETLNTIVDNLVIDAKDYDAESARHQAEVDASNSLPPEHRDNANVDRLNKWAERLDNENSDLLIRKDEIMDREAALKSSRASLVERGSALKAKMGLAYRQLQFCVNYANKIDKKMQTSGYDFTPGEALNGAKEDLKALSGAVFDTP